MDGEVAGRRSNADILREGYTQFGTGDIPAVLAKFDEGIVWSSPDSVRYGGTFTGPQQVAGFFATIPQNYTEFPVLPHTFLEVGDRVVVLGDLAGRTSAGRPLDLPFVHLWTMRDGTAVRFTEFFDTAKLNDALDPAGQPAPV